MPLPVLGFCLLIFFARVCDVSLGTLRTVAVINGRKGIAWILGFLEVLIWVYAVSKVIMHLDTFVYAVSYALGAASGSWIGITIEQRLAFGEQVVRIFSRKGTEIAGKLRAEGRRVTEMTGRGMSGPVEMLFIEAPRRDAMRIGKQARDIDPECYFVVDDIRMTSHALVRYQEPTGWRTLLKKK